MNNAATAAVMCPIAIGTASTLGVSADPFLMAVAIGASCAFLTPIGPQNNTLILGPGGFRFGDYRKLGLPLEIIVRRMARNTYSDSTQSEGGARPPWRFQASAYERSGGSGGFL